MESSVIDWYRTHQRYDAEEITLDECQIPGAAIGTST